MHPGHPLHPLLARLHRCGFDLSVAWSPRTPRSTGPPSDHAPRAYVLVANGRALWPRFVAWAAAQPTLEDLDDPLDRWVVEGVGPVLRAQPGFVSVQWAHDRGPDAFSALDAAEAAGLAIRGPAHLAVHPRLGPWFAVRALATFATSAPPPPPPIDVCGGCDAPCAVAFDRALGGRTHLGAPQVAAEWQRWLAVRDACPVGVDARYSDAQIRYHYTRDRDVLRAAVAAHRSSR